MSFWAPIWISLSSYKPIVDLSCSEWRHTVCTGNNNLVFFDVLLTVHLSLFISVINPLDAQNFCFTISLFHASTCFEHMCSSSGGQIALHSLWYHHTYRWPSRAPVTRRPPTVLMIPEAVECYFDLLMISTCARNMYWHEINLLKNKNSCIKLVSYWDKWFIYVNGPDNDMAKLSSFLLLWFIQRRCLHK